MNLPASVELAREELVRLAPSRLLVRARSITYAAADINLYEVVDPAGASLPEFTAGSHIDLYFRDRRIRCWCSILDCTSTGCFAIPCKELSRLRRRPQSCDFGSRGRMAKVALPRSRPSSGAGPR